MASSSHPASDSSVGGVAQRITDKILELAGRVPATHETAAADPHKRARAITRKAALKAAAVSGGLALPPGLAGLLTLLPDLALVWRLQAQMVADIAGAFGQAPTLSREQVLYCLFEHSAAQTLQDIVARVGERYVVRRTTLGTWRGVATRLGVKLARESVDRSLTRLLPLVGAAGVALYAYRDTKQVGATALEVFRRENVHEAAS